MSIKRNSAYNFLGGLLPLAVSIITVPIFLRLIGIERYGVLTLVWALLGYFGLFDFGLAKATAQRISASGDSAEARARTFWSALAANSLTSVIGGIAFFVVGAFFLTHVVKIESSLRAEAVAAMPILAAAVPVAIISGVLGGALMGREKFLEANLIGIFSSVITQLGPMFTAWLIGVRLSGLILSVIFARVLTLFLMWRVCREHVTKGARIEVSRSEIFALLGFGGWVTVSSFVGPVMIIFDRFVIGAVLGAAAVALYAVPWQLAQRVLQLPSALQTALFPRQAAASADEQRRLTQEGVRAIVTITTPLVIAGIFIMDPFLKLWLGSVFQPVSAEVGRIALIGFWALGLAYVPFAQVEARGHARTAAIVHLGEVPIYLGALFLLMKYFGLAGAAAAFALRCLADAAVFNRIALGNDALWKGPIWLGGLVVVAAAVASWASSLGWTWWAALATFSGVGIWLSYAEAPESLRQMMRSMPLKRAFQPR
jgi:O-antigen/teichoic acid export membrane protein